MLTIAAQTKCIITFPASPDACGHAVLVLRKASGVQDVDGVLFARHLPNGKVWVVQSLGDGVPWGSGTVKVFAIGEECLQPMHDQTAAVQPLLDASEAD